MAELTSIGRTGLITLGIINAFEEWNMPGVAVYSIASIGVTATFVSYSSTFIKKTLEQYDKLVAYHSNNQQAAEHQQLTKAKTVLSIIGWIIGGVTAATEAINVYVGWYTWLDLIGRPVTEANILAGCFGASSFVGWLGFVGAPTSKVFTLLADFNVDFESLRQRPIRRISQSAGSVIACLSGFGLAGVAFFAIESASVSLNIEQASLPTACSLTPFVFVSALSLYLVSVNKAVTDCADTMTNQNVLSQFQCDLNMVRSIMAMTIPTLTAGCTYVLGFASMQKPLEAIGSGPAVQLVVRHSVASCMSIVAVAVSGREGYELIADTGGYISQLMNLGSSRQQDIGSAVLINDESQATASSQVTINVAGEDPDHQDSNTLSANEINQGVPVKETTALLGSQYVPVTKNYYVQTSMLGMYDRRLDDEQTNTYRFSQSIN